MCQPGSETQAYTQQALAALQPEHTCHDTTHVSSSQQPPGPLEPPPPDPHHTAGHLLNLQMDLLTATEATGAGIHTAFWAKRKPDTGEVYTAEKKQQKGQRNSYTSYYRSWKAASTCRSTSTTAWTEWCTTAKRPRRHTTRPGEHPTRKPPTSNFQWQRGPGTRQTWSHTRAGNYLFEHSAKYDTWHLSCTDRCTSWPKRQSGPRTMVHTVLGDAHLPAGRRQRKNDSALLPGRHQRRARGTRASRRRRPRTTCTTWATRNTSTTSTTRGTQPSRRRRPRTA